MRAKVRIWTDYKGRWLAVDVSGDWDETWAIPYKALEAAKLLGAFERPPASSEGLIPGRAYAIKDSLTADELVKLLDQMHQVIAATRPNETGTPGLRLEDEREY